MRKIFFRLLILFSILFHYACRSKTEKNADVVIVDVADFGRGKIARQIAVLDSLGAKVIAIDLQFSQKKDSGIDSAFGLVLSNCKSKVVMASVIADYNPDEMVDNYAKLKTPISELGDGIPTGFINAILEDDEYNTLQRFSTHEKVSGEIEYHFAVRAAMAYDSAKTILFVQKNPKIVNVNYKGNIDFFTIFSAADVLNAKINRDDIAGKLVLVGSFSPFDGDIFFSPLSIKQKSPKPDMWGVVYLANIVVQILNDSSS